MTIKTNNAYPRRILLAVTGLSPQIVTETLYALCLVQKPAFIPTEVHLLTTTEGAKRATLNLLSTEGWFHRLRNDYDLPPIHFDTDCIHILKDSDGKPLDDIRSIEDNQYAADTIVNTVRKLTQTENTALHVSIAGGRKTMGFHAGYALSLYGRKQDCLSHVLVSGAYESHPDFYYPTPYSRVIHTRGENPCPMDTKEAEVMLAEIPFVCLRHYLPDELLDEETRYSMAVRALQEELAPAEIELDLVKRELRCGHKIISLSLAILVFYAWFVFRKKKGQAAINWHTADATEYLAVYANLAGGRESSRYEKAEESLSEGDGFSFSKEAFEYRKAKTKKSLVTALGERRANDYLFQAVGKRPNTRFEIGVPAEKITIIMPTSEKQEMPDFLTRRLT